ncbi:Exodeoxyribonuclease I subunit D [Mesonia phycicola]|uniref:Nuclease SbcCD subunit D n=1 Tax=Mesonia phycicola TaxID=579105 RepID=A0A1M6A824_9FLAO|nr:exonuclease SbcCD subunit D C-terminal domain-containing protein [Mesonia phycicola]SHI32632.1 Exodeoxyribonuclease I subunit D [Mesonia phycicola]
MKILHTADWHIGKKLHKHYLHEDFDLFINWLIPLILDKQIDAILISGDVFDLANPSAEARKQYYRALLQLRKTNCQLIITGGNHDSPSMLDAPKEILNELNVTVIGGMPKNIEECLIPLFNKNGEKEVIVAAIPFLRDSDLRSIEEEVVYENRIEAIRKGIEATFAKAAITSKKQFPKLPIIAMGHLYAAGIESSDSERDIQIGNQAAFQASQFGEEFSYVALGHIHKPQRVNAQIPTFYSGSPLPLSFSERKDEKRLLLIDTKNGFEPESITIPSFRKLIRISGVISEIQQKLITIQPQGELTNLIEVELKEDNYDANLIAQLDELVTNFKQTNCEIVKHRATFKNQLRESGKLFENHQHLEDLKPQEVFQKLLAQHSYTEDIKEKVNIAFQELLEEVNASH